MQTSSHARRVSDVAATRPKRRQALRLVPTALALGLALAFGPSAVAATVTLACPGGTVSTVFTGANDLVSACDNTLTGNNLYTGTTSVTAGRLVLTGNTQSSRFSIASGSVLELRRADPADFMPQGTRFEGQGTLVKSGNGLLSWSSSSQSATATFALGSGALIDVQAGSFYAGWNSQDWSSNKSNLNVASGATFVNLQNNVRVNTLTGAGTILSGAPAGNTSGITFGVDNGSGSFAGVLADMNSSYLGHFTKAGTGTQILTGANTYTGTTTLAGGVLGLGSAGALGNSGSISFAGGVLQFSAANTTDYSARFSQASGQAYNIDTNGQRVVFQSNLSSAGGSLTKQGAGSLVLTGSNRFSGGTTLAGGTLELGSAGAIGNAGTISFAGGTLRYSAANTTDHSARFSAAAGQAYQLDTNGQNVRLAANLTSVGGSLLKLGAGSLVLAGRNSFSAGVRLSAGVLELGSAGALGTAGSISFDGGTLRHGSANSSDYSARFSTADYQRYSIDTNGQDVVLASSLSSSGGSLTKLGSGVLTLAGSTNPLNSGVTVSAGELQIGNGGKSGELYSDLTGGAVLNNARLAFNRSDDFYSVSASINGTGTLIQRGTGTLILTGNNSFTGATILEAGALMLGSEQALGATGTISFAGGALMYGAEACERVSGISYPVCTPITTDLSARFSTDAGQRYIIDTGYSDVRFASALHSVGGTLTKRGQGTLTLAAANTYSGGTVLAHGTLELAHANALGSAGSISFLGGVLRYSETNTTDYSSRFSNAADQFYRIDTNDQDVTLATALTSAGGRLYKEGAGTLMLAGANSFSGGVTLGAGTLQLGSAQALGSSGTITFRGGVLQYTAANTTDYSARFDNAQSLWFAIDTNGQAVSFASGMTAPFGSLIKHGAGSLTLNAGSSFQDTNVNNGWLILEQPGVVVSTSRWADIGDHDEYFNDANVRVSGTGTRWDIGAGELRVGKTGSGSLYVTRGAVVDSGSSWISAPRGASVTVSGQGSQFNTAGTLVVSHYDENTYQRYGDKVYAPGSLSITDGGSVAATTLSLGAQATLTLDGGSLRIGSADVADGASFIWRSGSVSITQDAQLGSGLLGSSTTLGTGMSLQVAGTLALNSGQRLQVNGGSLRTGALMLNGGSLFTPQADSAIGSFSWASGTLGLTGDSQLGSGWLASSVTLDASKRLEVSGRLALGAGTRLELAGGAANIQTLVLDGGSFSGASQGTGIASLVWNSGTLNLSGEASLGAGLLASSTVLSAGKNLNLASSLNIGAGTQLELAGGTLKAQALNLAGGSLRIDGSSTAGSTFNWSSGTLNLSTDAALGTGLLKRTTVLAEGQSLAADQRLTVASGRLLVLDGGQFSAGTLALSGGSIVSNVGEVDLSRTGQLIGHGLVAGSVRGAAANTITASGGSLTLGDADAKGGYAFGGSLHIGSQQVVLLSADTAALGLLTTLGEGGSLVSINGAELGRGQTLSYSGNASIQGEFVNNGTVTAAAGSSGVLSFLNDVQGAGSFAGEVRFKADYSPGNSPAAVDFNGGDVSFDGSSTLTIELLNTVPGSGHDQLLNINQLSFDGTLNLVFGEDFSLTPGTRLSLFDFQSFVGRLDAEHITVSGYDESRLDLSRLGIDGSIGVAAAVPEPGTWALMLVGMWGVLGRVRRRQVVPAA